MSRGSLRMRFVTESMTELETQVAVLQSHLDALVENVQKNDAIQKRFQSIENRLLSLSSFRDLIEQVLADVRTRFDLDWRSLVVLDHDGDIHRCLSEEGFVFSQFPELLLVADESRIAHPFGRSGEIVLGLAEDRLPTAFLLPHAEPPNGSVVLIPLVRRGRYLGSLNLGSDDAERFGPGMATDFLARLGHVLSVCLENSLHFEKLRRTSLNDELTGVRNRRFYEQRLKDEVLRSSRNGDPLSCLFLDIDHFKSINDNWGHQVGDQALVHVADMIAGQLRSSDVLARYGGEEFVALLPTAQEDKALEVAERIRRTVANQSLPLATEDDELGMTVSVGVATFVPEADAGPEQIDGKALVDRADQALYKAKQSGRNRVVSGGVIQGANRPD